MDDYANPNLEVYVVSFRKVTVHLRSLLFIKIFLLKYIFPNINKALTICLVNANEQLEYSTPCLETFASLT